MHLHRDPFHYLCVYARNLCKEFGFPLDYVVRDSRYPSTFYSMSSLRYVIDPDFSSLWPFVSKIDPKLTFSYKIHYNYFSFEF